MAKALHILAIETSCDDTGIAILKDKHVLSNEICTQKVHEQYGGVVPELASRSHLKNIVPTLDIALKKANIDLKMIDAIAYTQGPGLLGSLMVGNNFAKGLAISLNKPIIGVNHLQSHIMAHFIGDNNPEFPFLCLLVSGGHTQMVLVKSYFDFEIIGQTRDDAVGEAFDKSAKILNLPYPGGPLIDKYAQKGSVKYQFPEGHVSDFDFSFSGFKTSVLYFVQNNLKINATFIDDNLSDICASIQHSIVKYLIKKLELAINHYQIKHVALAGGVAANSLLRSQFLSLANRKKIKSYIPDFEYCTDNAAMIGISAYFLLLNNKTSTINDIPYPKYQ